MLDRDRSDGDTLRLGYFRCGTISDRIASIRYCFIQSWKWETVNVNDELIRLDLPSIDHNAGANNKTNYPTDGANDKKMKREKHNCVRKLQWTCIIMHNILYLNVNEQSDF